MIFAAIDESVWRTAIERAVLFVPQVATAIVLFIVFWLVAISVERLIKRAGDARKMHGDALFVLSRAAKIALLAIGVVTALGTLGVDVADMWTGLGLTGFAVGFALK